MPDSAIVLPGLMFRSSHHVFHEANRSAMRVKARSSASAVQSSSHSPIVSWLRKYSSVASRTQAGGASPSRCHCRQPSMHQRRIAARSSHSFCGQFGVALTSRYLNGKGYKEQAPPHRFVHGAEARFMVAGDEQLEGRHEVEKVLPHEAGRQPITAGQGLDLGLVPAASLLCFLRHNQASAAQLGQIGRVALGVAGDERAHVGNRGVVAEDAGDEC